MALAMPDHMKSGQTCARGYACTWVGELVESTRPDSMDAAQETKSIMIVEDDYDVRDALVQVLEYEGYQVASAANGQEAIDRLRDGASPSLILLDLMMPVMDGRQFRARQMEDPSLAAIPVIIISADGRVDQKAAAMGVAAYLKKPIEVDNLLDLIARYCGAAPAAVSA
jgi:CheY-like chemotaxis protein